MSPDAEVTETTLEELHTLQNPEACPLGIVWISPKGETRMTRLEGSGRLVVGRADECDVVLEGPLVSRKHARLLRNAEFWFVEDLGSRNGVRLNGAAVTLGPLVEGKVLRVGTWIGVVRPFPATDVPPFGALGGGLFGGPELASAMRWVDVAASGDMPVVLVGETGTGKELFARAIHDGSRREGPFLAVNCAVFQPATAAAELFGYRRGAFTGAVDSHGGLIRAANGGTLFLDEIADLSLEIQGQLLRAIEERKVLALGESRATPVDVRFVAATQRALAERVSEGLFRADLLARLEGIRIELPPLRRRTGDVPLLFLHLLRAHSPSPPEPEARVLEWLALHDWPLNVRELVVLAQRILATYPSATELTLEQLMIVWSDPPVRRQPDGDAPVVATRRRRDDKRAFRAETVADFRAALDRHSGNVAKAAAELSISRQRAYRILRLCSKQPS